MCTLHFSDLQRAYRLENNSADGEALRITAESSMNENFRNFTTYLAASDMLIEQGTKEEIAEVARVLALHVAQYRQPDGAFSLRLTTD